MKESKQTLYELVTGVVLWFILFLLGNIFISYRLAYTLGLVLGCLIAVGMSSHMYYILRNAMLYDQETAAKKVQKGTVLRYLFMLTGLIAALLLPEYISIFGVALGILSLKFSAYLQPLTHKFLEKFINKGR